MGDYKLGSQLTTNVTYGTSVLGVENPSPSLWRLTISRVFTNNTGSTLNIEEVGLYCETNQYGTVNLATLCCDRSLYSISISNLISTQITYRLNITL